MRIGCILLVATACTSSKNVGGTLVYTEDGTENVRIRGLGNGDDQLIDSGQFGLVSIAPDAKHVA